MPGSRESGTEFYSGKTGSCNHHFSLAMLQILLKYNRKNWVLFFSLEIRDLGGGYMIPVTEMKFCRALQASWQCYELVINYILWLHVKSFFLARRHCSFIMPGYHFAGTNFSHVIALAPLAKWKCYLKEKETNLSNDNYLLCAGAESWLFKELFSFNHNFIFYKFNYSYNFNFDYSFNF